MTPRSKQRLVWIIVAAVIISFIAIDLVYLMGY
jgi:hypothetical protein